MPRAYDAYDVTAISLSGWCRCKTLAPLHSEMQKIKFESPQPFRLTASAQSYASLTRTCSLGISVLLRHLLLRLSGNPSSAGSLTCPAALGGDGGRVGQQRLTHRADKPVLGVHVGSCRRRATRRRQIVRAGQSCRCQPALPVHISSVVLPHPRLELLAVLPCSAAFSRACSNSGTVVVAISFGQLVMEGVTVVKVFFLPDSHVCVSHV